MDFYFNEVYLYIDEYFDLKLFYILNYATYFKMMIWNFSANVFISNKLFAKFYFFRQFSIYVSYLTIEFEEITQNYFSHETHVETLLFINLMTHILNAFDRENDFALFAIRDYFKLSGSNDSIITVKTKSELNF